jgi:hypothetical protein
LVILVDAVEYFEFVRDIPFRLPVSVGDPDHTCLRKAVVLKPLLSSVGFKARYALCRFSWNGLNIPPTLKAIPHEDVTHVYLEVYSEEHARWIAVDPTWDKGLSSKLPVSEWDGKNDTAIAVKPTERLNPIESQGEFEKFIDMPGIQKWLELPRSSPSKVNGQFYQALNKWVESVRT